MAQTSEIRTSIVGEVRGEGVQRKPWKNANGQGVIVSVTVLDQNDNKVEITLPDDSPDLPTGSKYLFPVDITTDVYRGVGQLRARCFDKPEPITANRPAAVPPAPTSAARAAS